MLKYTLYRALMRLAHRFDWHYAPTVGPFEDGSTQKWCKWCGFRQSSKRCPFTWPDWTVCRLRDGHEGYHQPVMLDKV